MKKLNTNQGFTLIEVMVALFILTVGMMGSTAMMLRSQQQAEETSIETTVAQRAWNIAELMRASISNVSSTSGDAIIFPITVSPGGTAPACISTGCNGGDMLDLTTFLIGMELQTFLPTESPTASINELSGDAKNPVLKVDVTWNKLVADGSEAIQTYTLIFQP
jgi:type IV pilus modification protein PilV